MNRYAMVIVVETETPERAWEYASDRMALNLKDGIGEKRASAVYVGDPCAVPLESADSYVTERIILRDEPVSSLIVTDPSAPGK